MSGSPVVNPNQQNIKLGNTSSGSLNPKDIGLDLTNLSPDAMDKIAKIIESANTLMTEAERHQKELEQKELFDYQNKLKKAIEKESSKEVFIIPKDTGTAYKFIGYSTDQFEEIMETANEADKLRGTVEEGSKKHLQLQTKVWKMTIKYSLENIPEAVIDKLPKQQINWLYLVLKEKNENPLPFDLNV